MLKMICTSCGFTFTIRGNSAWRKCKKCGGDGWWEGSSKHSGPQKHVEVPLKGSAQWYKEKWFRRDQKTWEADIKSRRSVTADGSVVGRFNEHGERIA